MASSDEKSLAVGHISGFQIDPKETLNKSSSAGGESFAPMPQTEKREIHAVFLRFPVFAWEQNPSLSVPADGIRASIKLF